MSNHNSFWGARFGYAHKSGDTAFVVKQMGCGKEGQGPHQLPWDPNSPRAKQSAHDKKEFARRGQPTIVFDAKRCRVEGPIWKVA